MNRLDTGEALDRKIKIDQSKSPIERLQPGSAHHEFVLQYLIRRLEISEREMQKNYDRWTISEYKHQAYLNLPKYEQMLKDMNKDGKPPAPAIIVFPYQYAVTSTIVTYLTRVFCGRNPIFPLSANTAVTAQNVKAMETLLQYNADRAKLIRAMFQYFLDGEMYGLGVMRVNWTEEWQNRKVIRPSSPLERMVGSQSPYQRETKLTRVYQGNSVLNIDPFMFFPDPNVPISMCAERGEFVFWRQFIGKHILLREEAFGGIRYISNVPTGMAQNVSKWYNLSSRNMLTGGEAHAGSAREHHQTGTNVYCLDQGTVEIIPAELGLGEADKPEKWLFTIANKKQIIQAEPFDLNHGRHPIAAIEPYTMGYGFSQPSLSDYIAPIQDIISWFIDSHIYNVRTALNNMWIVDPSKVEMQDILNPKPGKTIRLKPTAVGTDVRTVLQQLPVNDVTARHIGDMDAFIRIGDTVSAVNENLRGLQESGGRKTATEIRVSGDSASSRLAAHAQLISAQGVSELAGQMILNLQQLQDSEVYYQITGQMPMEVTPDMLNGDFMYKVHDGTLPIDKVAQLDVWKEIFNGVAQDQELRASYNLPQIFEWMARDLGGAANISSFRRQQPNQLPAIQPDIQNPQQIQQQVQQGSIVPIAQAR